MPDSAGRADHPAPTFGWRVAEAIRVRVRDPLRVRYREHVERLAPRGAELGFAASEWAARLTHRHEHIDLPSEITIDGKQLDTVDDLVAYTELPREVVLDAMTRRRYLSFRAEWLRSPRPLREDHWFY